MTMEKMKRKLCTFPNSLFSAMRKETLRRKKQLKHDFGMTDFIRDTMIKEMKSVEKKRSK